MTAAVEPAPTGDPSIMSSPNDPSIGPQRCTARSSRTGRRCGRWATRGAKVCASHGARAPQVKKAAARRVASAEALRTVSSLFGTPDEGAEPAEILAREIRDASGTVRALRALLDELDKDDALHGPGRAVVELHGERQARLIKAAESAIGLGIESRSQLLAEELAAGVAGIVRRLVTELDLTAEQRERAQQIAQTGLRALVPAATPGRDPR
jgi:hypothetical protein